MKKICARISADKNFLYLEGFGDNFVEDRYYPTGGSRLGTTVLNTKENLGITKSALPLLENFLSKGEVTGDDLGDFDWFGSNKYGYCFGWLGHFKRKYRLTDEGGFVLPRSCDVKGAIEGKHYVLLKDNEKFDVWEGEETVPTTHMVDWRGGKIEFCDKDISSSTDTSLSKPPWYIVRYRGKFWHPKKWNFCWLDYGGPPEVFLTKEQAQIRADAFMSQYGDKDKDSKDYRTLEVQVVPISMGRKPTYEVNDG